MDSTTQTNSQARPYAHLTARSFSSLIRSLDDVSSSATKIRRVADVDSPSSSSASSLSVAAFQALTGSKLAHLHRERRRSVKAQLTRHDAAQAGGSTYAPFSQAQLLSRIKELTTAPTTTWTGHEAKHTAPLELALRGWGRREGKIQCVTCAAEWSKHDVQDHSAWCPWRCRGCHVELFRVPVLTRHATLDAIGAEAESLARIDGLDKLQIEGLDDTTLASLACALPSNNGTSQAIALALLGWSLPSGSNDSPSINEALISCTFCARRLGLWSFATSAESANAPRRNLDAVMEHRSFCPLINAQVQAGSLRSAAAEVNEVDTPNSTQRELLPGWQLRLRCALGQKQARPRTEGEEELPSRAKMRKSVVLADVRSMLAPSPVQRGR